ncbi:hypothetical protein TNCV_1363271 [Trichonephila clavipes]|uniref:Uncharacterized protein n=1 Tax=Trichonephila clavipes TaxID=2585209 RepID=A0A8X6S2N9_TRICX|nr:hypothetical protein TNCV_1363271 [Trichonephila clavipes]
MAEDFPANGRASFRRVFGMGSARKKCDLRRERKSLHWSGSSSPIGRRSHSEEKGKLAERKIFSRERFNNLKHNEGRRKQHSRSFMARREPRVLTLRQS